MLKQISTFILLFSALFFLPFSAKAQPTIAVTIPDLCTPGLNTAIEIMAPVNQKGAFGNDGLYLNNPGDAIRVKTLRDADSNSIIFSPFVTSWDGRLISVQAFVKPIKAGGPNPNSWDWSLLSNQFRIPICILINGIQSSVDTLYIVQPFPFGDKSTNSQTSIFGTGTWGKRSRSGAMIVDSMILPPNGKFEVSKLDSDPYRNGNQGYLPFTLIVKGNVKGNNSIISVNANRQDGGPGGGGGAGAFTDFFTVPSRSGDGYSAGAPSGQNLGAFGKSSLSVGIGTGNNGGGKVSGSSITNVSGGEFKEYEGGGGGTGHPFGMSGSGWNYSVEVPGYFGGGSCPKDQRPGGGGGYREEGASTDGINGGKIHGNRATVPIAGGSGGAAGNPKGDRSGYGGGGGGAIFVHSIATSDLTIEARGAEGENNTPNGGGGSGGFVGIGARNSLSSFIEVTSGGPGGAGNAYGGVGRFRFESPTFPQGNPKGFPMINVEGQDSYRGLTLEYASIVDRSNPLSMVYSSGDSIQFYLKAKNGNWIPYIFGPAANGVPMIMPFNDINLLPDSVYYIMAIQWNKTFKTISEYQHEPIAIISQSAGNILYAPTFPIIASNTIVSMNNKLLCQDDTIKQTIYVKNTGTGELTIDSVRLMKGNDGFTIQKGTLPLKVKPNDSTAVTIIFTNPPSLGIKRDTLIVYSNARNDSTWTISLSGMKEVLSFAYQKIKSTNYIQSLVIDGTCIGTTRYDTLIIYNKSAVDIPSDSIRLNGSVHISIVPKQTSIPAFDNGIYIIQFSPVDNLLQTANLEFHHPLCDTIDIFRIEGKGIQTTLVSNPPSIVHPKQGIGTTIIDTIAIVNTGDASAFIQPSTFGLQPPFQMLKTIPLLPFTLRSGDSLSIVITSTLDTVGTFADTIVVESLSQTNSCSTTLSIPISATASLPTLGLRFNNTPKADPTFSTYEIPILYTSPGGNAVVADMSISFSINGLLFYPKNASKGTLSSTLDPNGKRIISVSFNKELLSPTDSLLTTISGIIQLDTVGSSSITWLPVKWNAFPYAQVITTNGNVELELCEKGDGKRFIINGKTPTLFSIFPNPASNTSIIHLDIPIKRLGTYTCIIRDLNGKHMHLSHFSCSNMNLLGTQYSLEMNTNGLSAGTYYISIECEGTIVTERLVIVP